MLTFWKPNAKNTGSLASFKVNAKSNREGEDFKEGCIFLSLVKQVGWNANTRKGSFGGGESINVKFNTGEIGSIIYALETNSKFSAYHDGQGHSTQITLAPWIDKTKNEQVGFGLIVNKKSDDGESKFMVGFKFGEGVQLREFLKFSLDHIFSASYAEDKRRAKESASKLEVKPTRPAKQEVIEEVEDDDDESLF